jgi:hypothetical protein
MLLPAFGVMVRILCQAAIVPRCAGVLQARRRMLEVAPYEFDPGIQPFQLLPGNRLCRLRLAD